MRQLEEAVQEARAFFGIDPLYELKIVPNGAGGKAARIDAGDPYRRCWIEVDLHYFSEHPEVIRRDMAHEVAHLMSNEVLQVRNRMPAEWRDTEHVAGGMLADAVETLTVRLERLFLRERPYAGGGVVHTKPEEPIDLARFVSL